MKSSINKYGFTTNTEQIPQHLLTLNSRIEKWQEMIENWEFYKNSKPKLLKNRIRKGIPNNLRSSIWPLLVDLSEIKRVYPKNHYFRLTNIVEDPPCMNTIEKDLDRTYPTHELFKSRFGQDSLRNILRAYAHFDPEIGYCQGMAYIVGIPRIFMDEESAFWMLVCILQRYDMRAMFKEGMEKVYQSYYKGNCLLKQFEGAVYKHLVSIGFFIQIYSTQWFMTIYSNFPIETRLRIWDCFLLEGPKILFRVYVAIFRMNRKQFKEVTFENALINLKLAEGAVNADDLMKAAFSLSLSKKKLRELEREFSYNPNKDMMSW